MYGDTDVLRRRVDQLREQAVDIRALADQLVARTESIGWIGRAADTMRLRVAERAAHLRGAAAQHETAADALVKHLQEVDRAKEAIATVERKATSIVAEARTRVSRIHQANDQANDGDEVGLRREPDLDDTAAAAFTAPPSGHQDWLTVNLPGL